MEKVILHLCADIGSDSRFYDLSDEYEVIRVGAEIGVENYTPPTKVHGVIANPVCTEFSTAKGFLKANNIDAGMVLVNHCLRIIDECKPEWWVLENPYNGRLKDVLGKPVCSYQPWQYGSPWTKKTALWGNFKMPAPLYKTWACVPKIDALYVRPSRGKPSLAFLHKNAKAHIREMDWASDRLMTDADLRSWCSQGFAKVFFEVNP